ncbi:DUF6166 domain-containing protein [Limnoglobus roseus]|uniref:Uncharacterized protein n=1 Tax=Limnoglobus roseus TaxID=2598579 RepID=A0A5C1AJX8_9BACT|nr:DUF6166 domain-containing protein [Limnoglobus roseus]QEL18503.1 hypothetical protein PX52LOC_05529 [Limnoglobus roseus]
MNAPLHPKTAAYVGVTIAGERFVSRISVNAVSSRLSLCTHLRQHAGELGWGDHGTAAAQLALAIMNDAVGRETALEWYHDFKAEVVSKLGASWVLNHGDVVDWVLGRSFSPVMAKGGAA